MTKDYNDEGVFIPAAENPWSEDAWNVTRQAKLVKDHGWEHGSKIAAAANSKIGDTRPGSTSPNYVPAQGDAETLARYGRALKQRRS